MKLNRRQLLGSAAAVAATAAAPAAMAAVKEEKTDLVIVGGGLGGLCAAYAAVRKGVKPIVLEKLQFLGGAGLFPEGSLGVNTRYTKEHGIKTTVQEVLDAALQYHHFRADPAILRVLIEESSRTIDDVLDLGIELRGIRTVYPKEESLQTWHLFKGGCAAVIQKFVEQVKAKGVNIAHVTLHVGLGTDVAGGFSLSMFRAIADAIQVSKLRWRLMDQTQAPVTLEEAFYMATIGGGSFFGKVGSFEKGYEFDAMILDDSNIRHPQEISTRDRLERLVYLSDDRNLVGKYVQGRKVI